MNPPTIERSAVPGFGGLPGAPSGEWIEIDPLCSTPFLASAEARGESGETLLVKLRGTLTAYTGQLVAGRVARALEAGFRRVVFDYRGVLLDERYRETLIEGVAGMLPREGGTLVALCPPAELVERWRKGGCLDKLVLAGALDEALAARIAAGPSASQPDKAETRDRWSKRGWA